jgi:septal ring factor EnvC (AmiA/AmiB activator)
MWQLQAQLALDIARERAEEARQQRLANEARAAAADEARRHHLPAAPRRSRLVAAAALRAVSGAFGSVSEAACDAATRIDRRTA